MAQSLKGKRKLTKLIPTHRLKLNGMHWPAWEALSVDQGGMKDGRKRVAAIVGKKPPDGYPLPVSR